MESEQPEKIMARKKKSAAQEPVQPVGEVLTRGDAWASAKAEYLDITRPRPRITALALKYDIDAASLIKSSHNQGWDELRSKQEALAAQSVSPEDRAKIIKAVDGATLAGINHVVQIGFAALATEMDALAKIEVSEKVDEKGKVRGYSRRQKISEIRDIMETATAAATALHAIGMSLTPAIDGPTGGLGEALKEAINVTPLCPDKTVIDNPPPTRLPPQVEKQSATEEKPAEPEVKPEVVKPVVKTPPPPIRPPV